MVGSGLGGRARWGRLLAVTDPLPFPEPVAFGIAGVRIGHWTDPRARTGCTVVLLPEGTTASGEVRGGAPASRETALLDPERLVQRLDAVVFSGGSAFGLAAADGVMRYLAERDVGFATGGGRVPIVVGLSIFDLLVGDGSVRPSADNGYQAADSAWNAAEGHVMPGRFGAGAGATVGKWRGPDGTRDGGIGAAVVRQGPLSVAALVVVNAFGDIDDGSSIADRLAAGALGPPHGSSGWGVTEPTAEDRREPPSGPSGAHDAWGNTTVGIVVTNARLSKRDCLLVAQGGHDGLARALVPAHTLVDGDAIVAAATAELSHPVPVDEVRLLAVAAVEAAIRSRA